MHDTKQQHTHTKVIESLKKQLRELERKCFLITDNEPALKNAFQEKYPGMLQLRCWNHAFKNLKYAAKKFFSKEETKLPAEAFDETNVPEFFIDGTN